MLLLRESIILIVCEVFEELLKGREDLRVDDIVREAARSMHLSNDCIFGGISPVRSYDSAARQRHIEEYGACHFLNRDQLVEMARYAMLREANYQLKKAGNKPMAAALCTMIGAIRAA